VRSLEPLGHAAVLEGLWTAARAGRLAHALLFSGPSGAGKFLAAERLTLGLLCARGPGAPCLACGPCKRALADHHPDVFVVDPEAEGEEEIKLQRIAPRAEDSTPNVGEFLSLKPMEGGWRIVLLREAERLNTEAQNALLKTLEEPGSDTLLVLVTARPDLLLATVHSRCVRVRFGAPAAEIASALLAREGVPSADIGPCVRWARGAPGEALRLARRAATPMRALLGAVASGELAVHQALAAYAELEGDFAGRTPSAGERVRARAFLDLALEVLADVRRARAGLDPAALAHGDLTAAGWARAGGRAEAALEECLRARQDVDLNLAPEAAVERVLLALAPRQPEVRGAGARPSPR